MSASDLAGSLLIREISVEDAEAVARLSGELGYPVSPVVMGHRIRKMMQLHDHIIYVACAQSGEVFAWIDVGIVQHLQAEAHGEIGGLVVSSEFRSMKIGKQLVERAERWAKQQGLCKMIVRSRITREAAHRFYLREGYAQVKTSAVFSKDLS